ncbi:MAG TPA: exodeoxyribonuclease V subunit alpha, partial [Solirubrobacteraceae bacterium]|nr:exodeoxyribonuclease V subunit alpha [Solirubrobacteraceae bacterium]
MTALDAYDARRALGASGLLREFNDAGVLAPADVHVARRLAELAGEHDEWASLAAALAVRGPRLGHVYVDLETIRDTATVDAEEPVDLATLPWPAADAWLARLEASPLVAVGEDGAGEADRPLRLVGTSLYLDRYWREERRLAADLRALRDRPPAAVGAAVLADGLARLFGDDADSRQRLAAEAAVRRRFAVVAGGPGTGKTTTVARIVALLYEQAAAGGSAEPLVGLAAPTGKAAARLIESVHEEAAGLSVSDAVRARLLALDASTLHRLLGWRPGTHSRFRHDRANRLPHDVVIVDETSMVSLSLMARLVEAVRPEARLVLVGDPGQLTSIEAGAVLGDIVGPAADATSAGGGIVILDRVHRYGGAIARVAESIRRGDADAVIEALDEVTWITSDAAASEDALAPIHDAAVASARAVMEAAAAGAGERAIEALGAFRLLCAHRRGDHGVTAWTSRIESWLAQEVDGFGAEGDWYVGRPLLVTENDYGLRLYNGDTGVVVASGPGRVTAAFERHGDVVEFSPTRLAAVETVYAMTVHKSQGSQFDTAA